jgi:hypothetical protein
VAGPWLGRTWLVWKFRAAPTSVPCNTSMMIVGQSNERKKYVKTIIQPQQNTHKLPSNVNTMTRPLTKRRKRKDSLQKWISGLPSPEPYQGLSSGQCAPLSNLVTPTKWELESQSVCGATFQRAAFRFARFRCGHKWKYLPMHMPFSIPERLPVGHL